MPNLTAPADPARARSAHGRADAPREDPAPPATRFARPGWRDPRLAVGLALVCLSVVLGARVLGTEEELTPVWVATRPVAAGETVAVQDVTTTSVRFESAQDAERYLDAGSDWVPMTAQRDVAQGELVPADALRAGEAELSELPLAAQSSGVPIGLAAGDRVDVWTVPLARVAAESPRGRQVLSDVPVLRVGSRGLSGPEATRQVVVGVPGDAALGATVGRLADSHVVLVRRP